MLVVFSPNQLQAVLVADHWTCVLMLQVVLVVNGEVVFMVHDHGFMGLVAGRD